MLATLSTRRARAHLGLAVAAQRRRHTARAGQVARAGIAANDAARLGVMAIDEARAGAVNLTTPRLMAIDLRVVTDLRRARAGRLVAVEMATLVAVRVASAR
jgi:hypothetical protein